MKDAASMANRELASKRIGRDFQRRADAADHRAGGPPFPSPF
jgi:hypothetical protein